MDININDDDDVVYVDKEEEETELQERTLHGTATTTKNMYRFLLSLTSDVD